ncbi:hypothetical protein N5V81_13070 [Escherichia coli]|nr:hypothetical protein [Escherichia coli]
MLADFVTQVEDVFIPMYERLAEIRRNHRLLGYWYDTYTTSQHWYFWPLPHLA